MSNEQQQENLYSYDEVPYASHPLSQTHPDRLATLATLFGMQPPAVETCRVLELGCASGGNLIPLAAAFPEGRFTGVDLSEQQVAKGQRTTEALELDNIILLRRDILEFDDVPQSFDYIICHGVFSWVPGEVKEKILDICASHLAANGVAYISYNTYPGWHLRGTVREMMEYHSRKFDSPLDRVKHSRALLDFLVKSVPAESNAFGMLLKSELDLLSNKADFYIYHEHLERFNEPLYFHQFTQQAKSKGLQYLAEADFGSMLVHNFPPHVQQVLRQLTNDTEELEQYMDFVRNRMFRQTLLCHDSVTLDRQIDPSRLRGMSMASAVCLEGAIDDDPAKFLGLKGTISTSDPLLKAALIQLQHAWPNDVPFETLAQNVFANVSKENVTDTVERTVCERRLGVALLDCFARNFVEFHLTTARFTSEIAETPEASPLARHQSGSQHWVTNLKHGLVELNDLELRILGMLDGNQNRETVLDALIQLVEIGELVVQQNGHPILDSEQARRLLAKSFDRSLEKFVKNALMKNGHRQTGREKRKERRPKR